MPGDPTHRPIILIVSGERALAEVLATSLRTSYEIRRAYDATQAIELVDMDVDVVLLDRATSGLEYDRFVSSLGERGADPRVALVLGPEADPVVAGQADDYLLRPVRPENVVDAVSRLAEVAKYDRDIGEFYDLARRKAALEARLSSDELATSEEYADLLVELEGYRELLDEELSEFDRHHQDLGFRELASV